MTLFRLTGFARKYWIWLLATFICLVATTAFNLATPWFLRLAIDTAMGNGDPVFLILMAVAVVGSSILRGIFVYGESYLSEVASQKTAYDIRNALYDRLQRLCFSYHDSNQTGQLMSRATADVEAVRMLYSMGIIQLVQFIVLSLGITAILLLLDWRLALISLAVLPLIGGIAVILNKNMRPIWLRVQQKIGKLGTILEENLTGVMVVKSFFRQKEESRKFAGAAKQLYNEQITGARVIAFNVPLMVTLMAVPTALILWYGGHQVILGNPTVGGLTQFIFYLTLLAMPTRRLGMLTNVFSRATSAGQRIFEILDMESSIKEKAGAIELEHVKGHIRFDTVDFGYNTVSSSLKNVSFEVLPGELVALIGPSGSGKSTIVNLIPRFYDVSSGRITIDGIDVRDVKLKSLRRNVGIVQQDIFLFSASIRDNIAYGVANASQDQIVAAAKAAYLHNFIESLPHGYDTWVGERGINLSGGEKQRLSIARTLLMNTPILIMDDSTSSVDASTEHLIRQALDKLVQGRTTFVITHRLSVIRNADLILVLDEGQIVEKGRHDELMRKNGLYKTVYESQLSMDVDEVEELQ